MVRTLPSDVHKTPRDFRGSNIHGCQGHVLLLSQSPYGCSSVFWDVWSKPSSVTEDAEEDNGRVAHMSPIQLQGQKTPSISQTQITFCVLINLIFRDWEPSDSFPFRNGAVGPCGDVSWVSPLYYCSTCVSATPRSCRLVQDISVCTDPPVWGPILCLSPQHLLYDSLVFDAFNVNMNFNHYMNCYTIIVVCTSWFIIWFFKHQSIRRVQIKTVFK